MSPAARPHGAGGVHGGGDGATGPLHPRADVRGELPNLLQTVREFHPGDANRGERVRNLLANRRREVRDLVRRAPHRSQRRDEREEKRAQRSAEHARHGGDGEIQSGRGGEDGCDGSGAVRGGGDGGGGGGRAEGERGGGGLARGSGRDPEVFRRGLGGGVGGDGDDRESGRRGNLRRKGKRGIPRTTSPARGARRGGAAREKDTSASLSASASTRAPRRLTGRVGEGSRTRSGALAPSCLTASCARTSLRVMSGRDAAAALAATARHRAEDRATGFPSATGTSPDIFQGAAGTGAREERERRRGGAANPTTPDENAAAVATPAASPLTSAQAATFILLELHGTRTNNAVFDDDGGVSILDLVGDATRECRGGRDETIGESSSLDRSLSLGVDPAKQRQRRETSARSLSSRSGGDSRK